MKYFLLKFLSAIKNINIVLLFEISYAILKKNYSKYPLYVKKFENSLAEKFNFKYCLTFSSGTAAFYASIESLQLKKKSKVLITSLTFPSIIEILKKKNFEIFYINLNKNFEFDLKKLKNANFDLCVLTHPFGFYLNYKDLKDILGENTKIIFDSSHSQGIEIEGKSHMKFANISFMSLQGNKSISGGEGGVIFTDEEDLYLKMINNHHPGHINNKKFKFAGGINDLKLRMHPLAAIIGYHDLKSFEKRNKKLKSKIIMIYNYLNDLKIQNPYNLKANISGFHYGIPFFFKGKLSDKIIKKYNWYKNLENLNIIPISKNKDQNFFEELFFLDLEWIKLNHTLDIKKKLKKIFKDVS